MWIGFGCLDTGIGMISGYAALGVLGEEVSVGVLRAEGRRRSMLVIFTVARLITSEPKGGESMSGMASEAVVPFATSVESLEDVVVIERERVMM